jgi:hypothetical protein
VFPTASPADSSMTGAAAIATTPVKNNRNSKRKKTLPNDRGRQRERLLEPERKSRLGLLGKWMQMKRELLTMLTLAERSPLNLLSK